MTKNKCKLMTLRAVGLLLILFLTNPVGAGSSNSVKEDRPDLVLENITVEPAEPHPGEFLAAGDRIRLVYYVKNQGIQQAQAFRVGFFLSIDNDILDDTDILLHEVSKSPLPPGSSVHQRTEIVLPGNIADGRHSILVRIDNRSEIEERDETNNIISAIISIGPGDIYETGWPDVERTTIVPQDDTQEAKNLWLSPDVIPMALPPGSVYRIPTVVHVVHGSSTPLGVDENRTDEEIIAEIERANERFRHASGLAFPNPYSGTDVQIELALARRDPDGKPTTGIIRYADDTNTINSMSSYNTQNTYNWPTGNYLNLYLVKTICNNSTCPNWNGVYGYSRTSLSSATEGIVFLGEFFWDGLTVHEAGHYFSLAHNFTNGCANNNCTVDGDQICDTPPKATSGGVGSGCVPSETCSTDEDDTDERNPFRPVALGGLGDQSDGNENYMDYSGGCWQAFTQGQKVRMHESIEANRSSLLSSDSLTPVFQDDAGLSGIVLPEKSIAGFTFAPVVTLWNFGSNVLNSVNINAEVDGAGAGTFSWSGSLAPGASVDVVLPTVTTTYGSHDICLSTSLPNGQADGYEPNDILCRAFDAFTHFIEDIEDGLLPDSWTVSDPDGVVTFDTAPTNCALKNGDYAVRYRSFEVNTSATGTNDILQTSVIDLRFFENAELIFDLSYDRTYSNRTTILDVSVSTDNGVTYESLYNKTEFDLSTKSSSVYEPTVEWQPSSCDDWRTETINLDGYVGSSILVKFTITIPEYWGQNLYLDNFLLSGEIRQGDVNNDGNIDLQDAILCLQVISGIYPAEQIFLQNDVGGDGRIGIEEAIHALQIISGLKP